MTDYISMLKQVSTYIDRTKFVGRSLNNNVVKISVSDSDSYRMLVKELKEKKVMYYTYQLKEERAHRVVLRYLHYSIPENEIKEAIEAENFQVRNVRNIRHWQTKQPLSLFFVDLEPSPDVKRIYDLQYLLNAKIRVESPKKRNDVLQCMRCQQYGHSKSYCTLPVVCVKCGGSHDNRQCNKAKEEKPTCALCGGEHPANYRGCEVFKKLHSQKFNQRTSAKSKPKAGQVPPSVENIEQNRQKPNGALLGLNTYATVIGRTGRVTKTPIPCTTQPVLAKKDEAPPPQGKLRTSSTTNILEEKLTELFEQNNKILSLLLKLLEKLLP